MTTYNTLDEITDLTKTEMSNAIPILFESNTDSSDKWDSDFSHVSSKNSDAIGLFSWNGIEGATYSFSAWSFLPPAIAIYDSVGNAIKVAIGNPIAVGDYSAELMNDFIAPYAGTYYVQTLWDVGRYYDIVGLFIHEDIDTAISTVKNNQPLGELTISGTAKQDEILTISSSLADEDGLGDFEYQWLRDGAEISDATTATYKPSANDIGKAISVKISYIDGEGTLEAVTSSATAPVTGKSATTGNDLLIGTNGNNKISGLAGNDTLVGGLGKDTLTGDSGADVFKFNSINETGKTSTTRDVITDFKHSEGDKIDMSDIDANSTSYGDQAFKFIGSKSFSGKAGELRFDSTNKILYGNVNNDKTPDFAIQLNGVKSLVADDFVL